MKRGELLLLVCILALAAGVRVYQLETVPGLSAQEALQGVAIVAGNASRDVLGMLQSWSVDQLGTTAVALRLPVVLIGVLTVLGAYLFARRLYDNRELAGMAAFLIAIGFWHVTISRIGVSTALPAFWATWGFYYLYKGIETHRVWHCGLSGAIFALGLTSTPAFWSVIAAAILSIIVWWWGMQVAFNHERFLHARRQAWGGLASMVGVFILVILPFLPARWDRPPEVPLAGQPLFFWVVSALLVAGILHTLFRVLSDIRRRGYPGVPHVLLLAWIGFAFWSHDLAVALPGAYILAAVGLHWLAVWLRKWYALRDKHLVCLPFERFAGRHCVGEGTLVVGIAMLALLLAIGVVETGRYHQGWAQAPRIEAAFPTDARDAARLVAESPPAVLKFVVTDRPAAVQYLSNTVTEAQRADRHVTYLTVAQYARTFVPRGALIIRLDD